MVAGDFDGDGKADVVSANAGSDNLSLLLGDGTGSLAMPQLTNTGAKYPYALVSGDFDGDGKLDLATPDNLSASVTVLLGTGKGAFQAPKHYAVGGTPSGLVAADFDNDGRADLATNTTTGNAVAILRGVGDGTFVPALQFTVPSPNGLTVADFNNDGKLDLAVFAANQVTILARRVDCFGERGEAEEPEEARLDAGGLDQRLIVGETLLEGVGARGSQNRLLSSDNSTPRAGPLTLDPW